MRNYILYPGRHRAIQIGMVAVGACVLMIGAVLIRFASIKPPQQIQIVMPITGLGNSGPDEGAVYWMDAASGSVPIVGRFVLSPNGGRVELRLRHEKQHDALRMRGVYWPSGVKSYVPHMQFLFDADLRNRLELIMENVWSDPTVRDQFARFIRTPGFRNMVIDFIVERIAARQGSGLRRTKRSASGTRPSAGFWERFDAEVPDWNVNDSDSDKPRSRLVRDPDLNRALDALIAELEPYFRSALDEILWTQAEDIPNARLIWVARRTLMGSGNSAILLIEDPAGVPIQNHATLPCREAP